MFVRVKKVGNYQYLQIAENRREGKRVKQTIIATLGGCRSETDPSSGPLTRKRHHVVGNVDFSPVGP